MVRLVISRCEKVSFNYCELVIFIVTEAFIENSYETGFTVQC